ncbi:MAG: hypothetical protein AAGC47_03595 [Bacteroidota bacterium]
MRSSLFLAFVIFSMELAAQTVEEIEAQMSPLQKVLSAEVSDDEKIAASDQFEELLVESFKLEETFMHDFFSIPKVAKHIADDKSFRMFNWNIPRSDGTHLYRMYLLFPNGKFVRFEDNSKLRHEDEKIILKSDQWYGALYYDLREFRVKKKKYFVLIGWDANDDLTTKKVLDVLVVGKKQNVSLGYPIFELGEELVNRRVFEYANDAIMNLRWLESKQMIIFDNLEPTQQNLKDQYAFYGPSTTFGGYRWDRDCWKLEDNIDMSRPKGSDSAPQFNFPERPDLNRTRDKKNPLTGK